MTTEEAKAILSQALTGRQRGIPGVNGQPVLNPSPALPLPSSGGVRGEYVPPLRGVPYDTTPGASR